MPLRSWQIAADRRRQRHGPSAADRQRQVEAERGKLGLTPSPERQRLFRAAQHEKEKRDRAIEGLEAQLAELDTNLAAYASIEDQQLREVQHGASDYTGEYVATQRRDLEGEHRKLVDQIQALRRESEAETTYSQLITQEGGFATLPESEQRFAQEREATGQQFVQRPEEPTPEVRQARARMVGVRREAGLTLPLRPLDEVIPQFDDLPVGEPVPQEAIKRGGTALSLAAAKETASVRQRIAQIDAQLASGVLSEMDAKLRREELHQLKRMVKDPLKYAGKMPANAGYLQERAQEAAAYEYEAPVYEKPQLTGDRETDRRLLATWSSLDTITPRLAKGRSPTLTVAGKVGHFDFDTPFQTGGTPGRRYLFKADDGQEFYFQLEKAYQGGRWEDAPHAQEDFAAFQAAAAEGPEGQARLRASLMGSWSGDRKVAEAIYDATLTGDFKNLQQRLAKLNTQRQISDDSAPEGLRPDEMLVQRRKAMDQTKLEHLPLDSRFHVSEKQQLASRRVWGDLPLMLAKGYVSVAGSFANLGSMAVPMTDTPLGPRRSDVSRGMVAGTLGSVGSFLDELGVKAEESREWYDQFYTKAYKEARATTEEADGVLETFKAALFNPSTIIGVTLESLPIMFASGGIGAIIKGGLGRLATSRFAMAAPKLAKLNKLSWAAAASAGEGLMAAGSAAEGMRQMSGGNLSTQQKLLAGATGIFTGLLGRGGAWMGKNWFGIADFDTIMAQSWSRERMEKVTGGWLKSAFQEGFLEELPQSLQEQVLQNYATQRPLGEGLDSATVFGTLAGVVTGGSMNGFMSLRQADMSPEVIDGYVQQMQARSKVLADKYRAFARVRAQEKSGDPDIINRVNTALDTVKAITDYNSLTRPHKRIVDEAFKTLEEVKPTSVSTTLVEGATKEEIQAIIDEGIPLSISAQPRTPRGRPKRIAKPQRELIENYVRAGGKVQVDSGGMEGTSATARITYKTPPNFDQSLTFIEGLAMAAQESKEGKPGNLVFVAPSKPGDLEGSQALMDQYADRLSNLMHLGVQVVVPVETEGDVPSVENQVSRILEVLPYQNLVIGVQGAGNTLAKKNKTTQIAQELKAVGDAFPALSRVHVFGLGDTTMLDELVLRTEIATDKKFTFSNDTNARGSRAVQTRMQQQTAETALVKQLRLITPLLEKAGVEKEVIDQATTAKELEGKGGRLEARRQIYDQIRPENVSREEFLAKPELLKAFLAISPGAAPELAAMDMAAETPESLTTKMDRSQLRSLAAVYKVEAKGTPKAVAHQIIQRAREVKLLQRQTKEGRQFHTVESLVAARSEEQLVSQAQRVGIATENLSSEQIADQLLTWAADVGVTGRGTQRAIHRESVGRIAEQAQAVKKDQTPLTETQRREYPDLADQPQTAMQNLASALAVEIGQAPEGVSRPPEQRTDLARLQTRPEDRDAFDAKVAEFDKAVAAMMAEDAVLPQSVVDTINRTLSWRGRPLLEATYPEKVITPLAAEVTPVREEERVPDRPIVPEVAEEGEALEEGELENYPDLALNTVIAESANQVRADQTSVFYMPRQEDLFKTPLNKQGVTNLAVRIHGVAVSDGTTLSPKQEVVLKFGEVGTTLDVYKALDRGRKTPEQLRAEAQHQFDQVLEDIAAAGFTVEQVAEALYPVPVPGDLPVTQESSKAAVDARRQAALKRLSNLEPSQSPEEVGPIALEGLLGYPLRTKSLTQAVGESAIAVRRNQIEAARMTAAAIGKAWEEATKPKTKGETAAETKKRHTARMSLLVQEYTDPGLVALTLPREVRRAHEQYLEEERELALSWVWDAKAQALIPQRGVGRIRKGLTKAEQRREAGERPLAFELALLETDTARIGATLGRWVQNYNVTGRKIQALLNQGVPPQYWWTGIMNLQLLDVNEGLNPKQIQDLFKDVTMVNPEVAQAYKSSSGHWLRQAIARAIFSLDSRIDYSDLTVRIGDVGPRAGEPLGQYNHRETLDGPPIRMITLNPGGQNLNTFVHELGHYLDMKFAEELLGASTLEPLSNMTDQEIKEAPFASLVRKQWALRVKQFHRDLLNNAQPGGVDPAYALDRAEVFSRFIDQYVDWATEQAHIGLPGKPLGDRHFKDTFTEKQFKAWTKLLQEKMYVDRVDGNELMKNVPQFKGKYPPPVWDSLVDLATSAMEGTENQPYINKTIWKEAFLQKLGGVVVQFEQKASLVPLGVVTQLREDEAALDRLYEAAAANLGPAQEAWVEEERPLTPIWAFTTLTGRQTHLVSATRGGQTPMVSTEGGLQRLDLSRVSQDQEYIGLVSDRFRGSGLLTQEERSSLTDTEVVERAVEVMTSNLESLWHSVPERDREVGRRWYEGANQIAREMSEVYGITREQAAAVIALLSPSQDWNINIPLAQRLVKTWRTLTEKNPKMDLRLFDQYADGQRKRIADRHKKDLEKITDRRTPNEQHELRQAAARVKAQAETVLEDRRARMLNKKYDDLENLGDKVIFLRAWEEQRSGDTRAFDLLHPHGASSGVPALTKGGAPRVMSWNTFGEIEKALDILQNGSDENIDLRLGEGPKVRSFYNNINAPESPDFVTIDTHAIAAAYHSAFGGSEGEVKAGMGGGTPSSVLLGVSGTNAIIAEAYFRAARNVSRSLKEEVLPREVLPRELQSVVWGAAQAFFPTAAKQGTRNKALEGSRDTPVTRDEVEVLLRTKQQNPNRTYGSRKLWNLYSRDGTISLDAIQRAIRIDSGGYRTPAWTDAEVPLPRDEDGVSTGLLAGEPRRVPADRRPRERRPQLAPRRPAAERAGPAPGRPQVGVVGEALPPAPAPPLRPGEIAFADTTFLAFLRRRDQAAVRQILTYLTSRNETSRDVPAFTSVVHDIVERPVGKGGMHPTQAWEPRNILQLFYNYPTAQRGWSVERLLKEGTPNMKSGATSAEMEWMGLPEMLEGVELSSEKKQTELMIAMGYTVEEIQAFRASYPNGKMTKAQLLEFIDAHSLELVEVQRGAAPLPSSAEVKLWGEEVRVSETQRKQRQDKVERLLAESEDAYSLEEQGASTEDFANLLEGLRLRTELQYLDHIAASPTLTTSILSTDNRDSTAAYATWQVKKAAAQVQYRAREWALNELAKMYDRHAETVRGEPEYVSTGVTGSAFVPGQMMEASYRQFRYRWDALFQYVTEVLHAEPDQTLSRKGHPQDNAQYSLIGNYINTLMAVQMAAPGNTMDLAELVTNPLLLQGLRHDFLATQHHYVVPEETVTRAEDWRRIVKIELPLSSSPIQSVIEALETFREVADATPAFQPGHGGSRDIDQIDEAVQSFGEYGGHGSYMGYTIPGAVPDTYREIALVVKQKLDPADQSVLSKRNAVSWDMHSFPVGTIMHLRMVDRVERTYTVEDIDRIEANLFTAVESYEGESAPINEWKRLVAKGVSSHPDPRTSPFGGRFLTESIAEWGLATGAITPLEHAQLTHSRRWSGNTEGATEKILFIEELQSDWMNTARTVIKDTVGAAFRTINLPPEQKDFRGIPAAELERLNRENAQALEGEKRDGPVVWTVAGLTIFDEKARRTIRTNVLEGREPHAGVAFPGKGFEMSAREKKMNALVKRRYNKLAGPERASDATILAKVGDRPGVTEIVQSHQKVLEREALYDELRALSGQDGGLPSQAPFPNTWTRLGLRRIARYAAAEGYASIGWTGGRTQYLRYHRRGPKFSRVRWLTEQRSVFATHLPGRRIRHGEFFLPEGDREGPRITFTANIDTGKIIFSSEPWMTGLPISEVLGQRGLVRMSRDEEGDVASPDLILGAQGQVGYYDRTFVTTMRTLMGNRRWRPAGMSKAASHALVEERVLQEEGLSVQDAANDFRREQETIYIGKDLDPVEVRKLIEEFPSLEELLTYEPTEATGGVPPEEFKNRIADLTAPARPPAGTQIAARLRAPVPAGRQALPEDDDDVVTVHDGGGDPVEVLRHLTEEFETPHGSEFEFLFPPTIYQGMTDDQLARLENLLESQVLGDVTPDDHPQPGFLRGVLQRMADRARNGQDPLGSTEDTSALIQWHMLQRAEAGEAAPTEDELDGWGTGRLPMPLEDVHVGSDPHNLLASDVRDFIQQAQLEAAAQHGPPVVSIDWMADAGMRLDARRWMADVGIRPATGLAPVQAQATRQLPAWEGTALENVPLLEGLTRPQITELEKLLEQQIGRVIAGDIDLENMPLGGVVDVADQGNVVLSLDDLSWGFLGGVLQRMADRGTDPPQFSEDHFKLLELQVALRLVAQQEAREEQVNLALPADTPLPGVTADEVALWRQQGGPLPILSADWGNEFVTGDIAEFINRSRTANQQGGTALALPGQALEAPDLTVDDPIAQLDIESDRYGFPRDATIIEGLSEDQLAELERRLEERISPSDDEDPLIFDDMQGLAQWPEPGFLRGALSEGVGEEPTSAQISQLVRFEQALREVYVHEQKQIAEREGRLEEFDPAAWHGAEVARLPATQEEMQAWIARDRDVPLLSRHWDRELLGPHIVNLIRAMRHENAVNLLGDERFVGARGGPQAALQPQPRVELFGDETTWQDLEAEPWMEGSMTSGLTSDQLGVLENNLVGELYTGFGPLPTEWLNRLTGTLKILKEEPDQLGRHGIAKNAWIAYDRRRRELRGERVAEPEEIGPDFIPDVLEGNWLHIFQSDDLARTVRDMRLENMAPELREEITGSAETGLVPAQTPALPAAAPQALPARRDEDTAELVRGDALSILTRIAQEMEQVLVDRGLDADTIVGELPYVQQFELAREFRLIVQENLTPVADERGDPEETMVRPIVAAYLRGSFSTKTKPVNYWHMPVTAEMKASVATSADPYFSARVLTTAELTTLAEKHMNGDELAMERRLAELGFMVDRQQPGKTARVSPRNRVFDEVSKKEAAGWKRMLVELTSFEELWDLHRNFTGGKPQEKGLQAFTDVSAWNDEDLSFEKPGKREYAVAFSSSFVLDPTVDGEERGFSNRHVVLAHEAMWPTTLNIWETPGGSGIDLAITVVEAAKQSDRNVVSNHTIDYYRNAKETNTFGSETSKEFRQEMLNSHLAMQALQVIAQKGMAGRPVRELVRARAAADEGTTTLQLAEAMLAAGTQPAPGVLEGETPVSLSKEGDPGDLLMNDKKWKKTQAAQRLQAERDLEEDNLAAANALEPTPDPQVTQAMAMAEAYYSPEEFGQISRMVADIETSNPGEVTDTAKVVTYLQWAWAASHGQSTWKKEQEAEGLLGFPITLGEIQQTFGDEIATAVEHLRRLEGMTDAEYLQQVKKNHVAVIVKQGELRTRMQRRKLAPATKKTYQKALQVLEESNLRRMAMGPEDEAPGGPEFTPEEILESDGPEPDEPLMPPSEIIKGLSKALDNLPVSVGGMGAVGKGVLGLYKIESKAVRVRMANDWETVFHEFGHHIGRRILQIGRDPVTGRLSHREGWSQELVRLGRATSPSQSADWYLRKEGEAEFFRLWVTDKEEAQRLAPLYYEAFSKAINSVTDAETKRIVASIKVSQREMHRYNAANPDMRLEAKVSHGVEATTPESWLERLETQMINDLAPMRRAVQGMHALRTGRQRSGLYNFLGEGGLPEDILDDGFRLAELAKGSTMKAWSALEFGVRDSAGNLINGASFMKALHAALKGAGRKEAKQRIKDFGNYLVARHVPELRRRGIETYVTLEEAEAFLKKHKSPAFEEAAKQVDRFQSAMLTYAVQMNMVSREQANLMRKAYEYYVPFQRVMDGVESRMTGGPSSSLAGQASPFKRIKGSGRDIINPLESIVKNAHTLINAIDANRATEVLTRQADEIAKETYAKTGTSGVAQWIERVPDPKQATTFNLEQAAPQIKKALEEQGIELPDNVDFNQLITVFTPQSFSAAGKNYISVLRKGKRVWYQINNQPLFDSITGMGSSAKLNFALLVKPASLLRNAATMTVEFAARNPVRDTIEAGALSKYGFVPLYDTAKGMFWAVGKTEEYQKFLWFGAGGRSLVSPDRDLINEHLKKMTRQQRADFLASIPSNPLEALRAMQEVMENSSRIGEFMRGVNKLGTSPTAYLQSAHSAAEVTVNFRRAGVSGREWNRASAFFNAGLQGNMRIFEALVRNPVRFLSYGALYIGGLSTVVWLINHNDEEWRELPEWEKDAYWHFPSSLGKGHRWVRIPKPWNLGHIFGNSLEAALDYIYELEDGEETLRQILPDRMSAVETLGWLIPTAILPMIESVTNYSMYRRAPIIGEYRKNLEPELQAGRWTSMTARNIAGWLDQKWMGATKIEHLLSGHIAGWGKLGLQVADKFIEEKVRTEKEWEEVERQLLGDVPLEKGRWPDVLAFFSGEERYSLRDQGQPGAVSPLFELPTHAENWPLVRAFFRGPAYMGGPRSLERFYEDRAALQGVLESYDFYDRTGQTAKMNGVYEDNQILFFLENSIKNTDQILSRAWAEIREYEEDATLTPEQREEYSIAKFKEILDETRAMYFRETLYMPADRSKPHDPEAKVSGGFLHRLVSEYIEGRRDRAQTIQLLEAGGYSHEDATRLVDEGGTR